MSSSRLKVIRLSLTTLIIFMWIGITGLISALTVSQSVDAWHAIFQSREECMYFLKTEFLNTTGEAARTCDKIIPHTNVTIATDNKTNIVHLENK